MATLMELYKANLKDVKTSLIEEVNLNIKNVLKFKDDKKLILVDDKGIKYFVFKDSINVDNVDRIPQSFKCVATFKQNGEYVNVIKVVIDQDTLSKRDFIITNRLVVAL